MVHRGLISIQLCLYISVVFCLSLYILGITHYLTNHEPSTCDLTYMFEYPEFVSIKLDDKTKDKYPQYGLYAYGEGYTAEKLRQMKYSGIPVLFIPGNAGSHEQVRSIASISLRMSLKRRTSFHFDYFTISFNEGLSALSGGVIEKQTEYIPICIQRILSLYNGKLDQIVVIGHSMGGVVARAALIHYSSSNISQASILINLASPHVPLVAFDKTFANYYDNITNHADRIKKTGTTVISIGGGPRDHMVTTSQIIDPLADLNVLSTAIPNVWTSLDHLSILWCKQFVIALVRGLFDSVEITGRTAKITSNTEHKLRALKYHLSNRYSTKYLPKFEEKMNFDTDGEWIEINSEHYTFDISTKKIDKREYKQIYLMIPLNSKSHSHLSVDTIDLDTKDWLFICSISNTKKNSKLCKWGWNLTNRTILSPDFQLRTRKSIDIELKSLHKFNESTHMVIRIPQIELRKKASPIIHINMYSRNKRQIRINSVSPAWLPLSLANLVTTSESALINTSPGTLRYFIDVTSIPDAVYIKVNSITDNNSNNSPGYVVIQFKELCNTQNSAISQFYIFHEKNIRRQRTFHLQTEIGTLNRTNNAEIIMSFDPRFQYSIKVGRAGIIDRMENFVKNRAYRLYPTIISTLLLIVVARMDNSQYSLSITFGITLIASIIFDLHFEICVALGILLILSVTICCAIVFSGTMIHNVTARFLARALARFPASWYNWLIRQSLNQFPLVAIFLLIVFTSSGCGALVMVLSVLLYFLKLTCMYEDYLENFLMSSFRNFISKFRKFNKYKSKKKCIEESESINSTADIINHLLLFMIWFLTAGSAVPSTLVWAKNFSYETRLSTEDPIMLGSWIVLAVWSSLGFVKLPIMFEYHCYRLDPITIAQRIFGWLLLWIAGSHNPADHQWMIPPIVALFMSCHYIRQHCLYLTYYNPKFSELKNV
ncbi:hypothetical protein PV328_006274 [Microctonus aethiopoides]|uniref:GPI inositol-deacylase n=1 Tax=Microctonus aethiopoides TaxID=144406 RepID=A0AA39KTC5_9HYME|nr:hypothetical protein PV328_006274 [Microctonus aethiopoides]